MNQSSPADAAAGVALATQRGAGSALAPRNWGVTGWLILLVAVPTVLALALTGLRVTDMMRSARADGQVSRLAMLGQQIGGLAQAMEDERSDTAAFLADGRPAAGLAALHRQYVVTDGWAATVRRQVGQLGRGYQPQTQASAATVLASIAELPGLRRQATERQAPALAVINAYSGATAGLFGVNDSIADSSGNPALISSVRALGSLSRMTDQAAQQQAILGAALAEGHFGPGALGALTVAQARQASDLASFRSSATPEETWALTDTLAGPLAAQARAVEQRAALVGTGPLVLGAPARQQWRVGMSYTVGWMRQAEQQLGTWTTAYAQALRRGAIRSAIITGGLALAVLIVVLLAAWAMARSLGRRLRRLEWLAGEGARLRGSIGAIFASYFGRSQALQERLLRHIHGLELGEDDPERLASLFQMDHLATRMRRNSDSALVLAGLQTAGGQTEPVTLVDVLRAAVSEIEQYDRVVLDIQQGVWVSGSAAADTAHLLAELLENATTFSPQATRVVVSGHATRGGGSLISISDGGMGLPEERLRQLNEKLAHPPLAGPAIVTQMGLVAVAHLAARHGTTVTLTPRPGGGTTAEVRLPAALISLDARPGGWPRQSGAGRPPGTGRGAFGPAAEPRPAWVAAGPELAAGPRITAPDGVPVTLGAPLPSPATSAFGQVIMPEPVDTEPGAAPPIFESVESDYLQAHGLGRPGTPVDGVMQVGPSVADVAVDGARVADAAVADVAVDGARVADGPVADVPVGGGAVAGDLTSAGLPRRIPQATVVPDAAAGLPPRQATAAVSAQIALDRLASFQRGSRRARVRARINRDVTRPARATEGTSVDPAPHPQALDQLITDFTERVPTVLHALVVSSDGVPVAVSDRIQPDHVEKLSVITSGLISLSAGAARIFDVGTVTQAVVAMERGTVVIMAIDDGSSLAVLTSATADLDLVAYEMTMLADQAGRIFTPPLRRPPHGEQDG